MKSFDREQLRQIRIGREKGVDVSVYARPEFDWMQMGEIRKGLEKGMDVSAYARPELSAEQMFIVRQGMAAGLDPSVYAKPEFNAEQMRQICRGLQVGLDVSIYARPEFSWSQMSQIRKGLEKGMDVSAYAKPELSAEQMWEAREGKKTVIPSLERFMPEPGDPPDGELGLFVVSNSVGGSVMVVARDSENAKALAIGAGLVRDLKLARCVRFNAERFLAGEKEPAAAQSLREILAAGKQGILRRYMPDWMEKEFRAGKREYTCIYGLRENEAPGKAPTAIAESYRYRSTRKIGPGAYWG